MNPFYKLNETLAKIDNEQEQIKQEVAKAAEKTPARKSLEESLRSDMKALMEDGTGGMNFSGSGSLEEESDYGYEGYFDMMDAARDFTKKWAKKYPGNPFQSAAKNESDYERFADIFVTNVLKNNGNEITPVAMEKGRSDFDYFVNQEFDMLRDYYKEDITDEGNEFSGALANAKKDHKSEFEVDGKEYDVREGGCGMMPAPNGMMGNREPSQQDSVNMNVSLNAAGPGGIKDLMDILKGIEDDEIGNFGDDGDIGPEVMIKKIGAPGMDMIDDDYENTPDETYQGVDAVTQTGNDLHSKGIEAPAANGGGNPMALKTRLESLYHEVKNR
jgi:hypothetical protein